MFLLCHLNPGLHHSAAAKTVSIIKCVCVFTQPAAVAFRAAEVVGRFPFLFAVQITNVSKSIQVCRVRFLTVHRYSERSSCTKTTEHRRQPVARHNRHLHTRRRELKTLQKLQPLNLPAWTPPTILPSCFCATSAVSGGCERAAGPSSSWRRARRRPTAARCSRRRWHPP